MIRNKLISAAFKKKIAKNLYFSVELNQIEYLKKLTKTIV